MYYLVNEKNSKVITAQKTIDALLPSVKTAVEAGLVVIIFKEDAS